jgi:hypothetical protein
MARPSTIDRLPAELRELVLAMRENGRAIDTILAELHQRGAQVSRSALGRRTKKIDADLEHGRRAGRLARAMLAEMG